MGGSVTPFDGEGSSVGGEAGFEAFEGVFVVGEYIRGSIIGSDGEAVVSWESFAELEGVYASLSKVVGDTVDVFEFISHRSAFYGCGGAFQI